MLISARTKRAHSDCPVVRCWYSMIYDNRHILEQILAPSRVPSRVDWGVLVRTSVGMNERWRPSNTPLITAMGGCRRVYSCLRSIDSR